MEGSNKQKIYIYFKKRKENTFINPPFVKREIEQSKNEIINILTHRMCTESARIRTKKGSLRVKVEKEEEDAHNCQPEKKVYTKKRKKVEQVNAQKYTKKKDSSNIFCMLFFLS
jgi:hypothetical protein